MVSSPKDQKQGDSTEKQADPISIYNQLDHRHKQKSACQEHNAIHSASSRSIVSHVDVQHPSGRLDQSVLILTLPLNLSAHLAIRHAVYGFPILNGVIMLQYVRCHIVGVVYHPVGVHAVEVVLDRSRVLIPTVSMSISSVPSMLKKRTLTPKRINRSGPSI